MTAEELDLTDLIAEGRFWWFVRGVNSADQARKLAGAPPDRECQCVYRDVWGVAKEEGE